MLYVIPDTLLKVAFNTNKTGHHGIRYTWHIIGGGVQHELNWSPCYTFNLTHCWKWHWTSILLVSMLYAIPDTLLKGAFNTNKTGHHVIRYTWHIVESSVQHQYNWPSCYTLYLTHCWKWRSTPIKLTNLLYVILDTLLKVALSTNKTVHHVIPYTWHIIENGVQHQ
jgi:hypothetical protein